MSQWQESKYQSGSKGLVASRNTAEVSVSSRIIITLVGQFYSRHIPTHIRGDLIDLGCGKSPLFGTYCQYSTCQHFLDIKNRLQHTDLNYRASLNEPITNITKLYDSAILSDVLEHLARPEIALASINRMLKKQGVLLMTVPFLYGIHEAPHDFRRFTRFGLEYELKRAGFTRIEIHEIGGIVSAIATMMLKLLSMGVGSNSWPIKLGVSLYHLLMRLPFIAWADQKSSKSYPLEYGVICYTD